MTNVDTIYTELIEKYGINEELLRVITDINGYNVKTLDDVIYSIYGYQDFEQLKAEW